MPYQITKRNVYPRSQEDEDEGDGGGNRSRENKEKVGTIV